LNERILWRFYPKTALITEGCLRFHQTRSHTKNKHEKTENLHAFKICITFWL
jgi:hypothetical protein